MKLLIVFEVINIAGSGKLLNMAVSQKRTFCSVTYFDLLHIVVKNLQILKLLKVTLLFNKIILYYIF